MQEQSDAEKRAEQPPAEAKRQAADKANGSAPEELAKQQTIPEEEEQQAHAAEDPAAEQQGPNADGQDAQAAEAESAATVAREEFDALEDRYKRAHAEVANIRRRTEREKLEAVKFGSSRMASDLLPIHDNLKRALSSIDDAQRDAAPALIEGIELTLRELLNALKRHGVEIVDPATGEVFDPQCHQAMLEAPTPDVEAGKILQVMTEGFRMHERLLRPAQVIVSSGPPPGAVEVEVEKTRA